jgi:hypothetical protein
LLAFTLSTLRKQPPFGKDVEVTPPAIEENDYFSPFVEQRTYSSLDRVSIAVDFSSVSRQKDMGILLDIVEVRVQLEGRRALYGLAV